MKYNIGDTVYWIESGSNYGKTEPCAMCFGKRFVTIILGDDSQTKVACGFCERGLEGSTGYHTNWEPMAVVKSGIITGVSTKSGIRYEVGYNSLFEHQVYSNESDAELARAIEYEEVKKQARKWFEDKFITCTKKQVWSAGYHRNCIKHAKRDIEWHELKLGIIKEKSKDA